jgi:hypothetical protein
MFIKSLLIGCIGLSSVVGTALATGDHHKDKNEPKQHESGGPHSGDAKNHNHTCTVVTINNFKNGNGSSGQKCATPTPTPVQTPVVTPKPTRSPKVTPTPVVTPTPTPVSTPAASQTVKSAAPAVLPSVGADGK